MTEGIRLRPLVEVVDDHGTLYLLRGPVAGDCVIRDPPPAVRPLLAALKEGGSVAQLAARVRAAGHSVSDHDVRAMLDDLGRAQLTEPARPFDWEGRLSRQLLYLGDRAPDGLHAETLQQRVSTAHVVVLGCGGLGSWVAAGLACIGIQGVTLVDDDHVELSNLNRQVLFSEDDLGRPKVEAAADTLRAFNSTLTVVPIHDTLASESDVRRAIAGASFVVACVDRPRYVIARWVNSACLAHGVPHIGCGQVPPVVRVGPLVIPGRTPCVECLELAFREENPLYDRIESVRAAATRPTATLGPASGIIGQVIASEILHFMTGLVEPASLGAVWAMDLRTLRCERRRFHRRSECSACWPASASDEVHSVPPSPVSRA